MRLRPRNESSAEGDAALEPSGRRGRVLDGPRGRRTLPLLQAWSGLRDAMVLASTGAATEGPVILAVNDAFRHLFGLSEGEAHGRELASLLTTEDEEALLADIRAKVLEGEESMTFLSVVETVRDGPRLLEWELAPVRDARGQVLSLIGVLGEARSSTISQSIRGLDAEQMGEASDRVHFLRRIERCLERVRQRSAYGFAVLGLEIDGDTVMRRRLGEAVGEAVLDAFASRLQRCLRPEDLVARIGPDRLGVLLDGFSPDGGVGGVVHRIEDVTETPFTLAGETIWLSGVRSSGLAYSGDHLPESAGEVLDRLD